MSRRRTTSVDFATAGPVEAFFKRMELLEAVAAAAVEAIPATKVEKPSTCGWPYRCAPKVTRAMLDKCRAWGAVFPKS